MSQILQLVELTQARVTSINKSQLTLIAAKLINKHKTNKTQLLHIKMELRLIIKWCKNHNNYNNAKKFYKMSAILKSNNNPILKMPSHKSFKNLILKTGKLQLTEVSLGLK